MLHWRLNAEQCILARLIGKLDASQIRDSRSTPEECQIDPPEPAVIALLT